MDSVLAVNPGGTGAGCRRDGRSFSHLRKIRKMGGGAAGVTFPAAENTGVSGYGYGGETGGTAGRISSVGVKVSFSLFGWRQGCRH